MNRRVAPGPTPLPDRAIWVDGWLRRAGDATLSLFDRGARDGEGLFETLRVQGGRPFQWEQHLERLVLSAAELGFPVPPSPATLLAAIEEVLFAGQYEEAVVRITVTRGIPGGRPTRTGCWVEAEAIQARLWRGFRAGRMAAVFSKTAFEPGGLGCHKTTSRLAYHLAREEARARRADEALLVSPAGDVLEGATSNVFAVFGSEVVTPPLSTRILPGITRATVLGLGQRMGIPIRERVIGRGALEEADEVFLTNSVQGVVPVAELEGRSLPSHSIGGRLRTAYMAEFDHACPCILPKA